MKLTIHGYSYTKQESFIEEIEVESYPDDTKNDILERAVAISKSKLGDIVIAYIIGI